MADESRLPSTTQLDALPDQAFDRIADLVRRVLDVPIGIVSLVDAERQVFPGASGLPPDLDECRFTPLSYSYCQYVVLTEAPLVVTDARLDPVLRSNLATTEVGVVGYAGMPLVDLDGRVVGSLCAIDTEPREWTDEQLALLADLAATCSAELQLRAAAGVARDTQTRAAVLLELSETLSATSTTADISLAVGKLTTGRLGAAFGGISVLDAEHEMLTYVDLSALPDGVDTEFRTFSLAVATPSATVARTGLPLFFENLDEVQAQYPAAVAPLTRSDARACAYLPLSVAGRILGTLGILWTDPRSFDAADRALLDGLSRYTAQAVERAQLFADRRDVAEVLQTAMLPVLPRVAGVELAGSYLPARDSDAVGGDWFDAFELPDGTLAISIGDVAGHDTVAAAVMGQLRSTLRSLAITVPGEPSDVLTAADNVLSFLPIERYATSVLGAVTGPAGDRSFTWSNAGHLPPLLVTPGVAPVLLERTPAVPLGLPLRAPVRAAHTVPLPAGSTLIMYTDGLVERRTVGMDAMFEQLLDAVERHRDLPLAHLVDAVLLDLVRGEHDDDVAVLAVRIPD